MCCTGHYNDDTEYNESNHVLSTLANCNKLWFSFGSRWCCAKVCPIYLISFWYSKKINVRHFVSLNVQANFMSKLFVFIHSGHSEALRQWPRRTCLREVAGLNCDDVFIFVWLYKLQSKGCINKQTLVCVSNLVKIEFETAIFRPDYVSLVLRGISGLFGSHYNQVSYFYSPMQGFIERIEESQITLCSRLHLEIAMVMFSVTFTSLF